MTLNLAPNSPARMTPDQHELIVSSYRDAETLVDVLRGRAEREGDRVALRFLAPDGDERETLDYRELDRRARAIAARLQTSAAPGDRALILLGSGPDYVAAFFGCLYAGMIAIPAYPPDPLRPHHVGRLSAMIRDAAPHVALTSRQAFADVQALCAEHEGVAACCVPDMLDGPASGWRPAPAAGGDVAFLQYTSGSTSAPKGVEVTHANLIDNQLTMVRGFGIRTSDVVVSWLPLYHDMGLIAGLVLPIFCGIPLALMPPEDFLARPTRWLTAIQRYGGTISGGPDFAFRLVAERVGDAALATLDLSSWRVAYCGSEPVRAETMRGFAERFAAAGFSAEALHPSYGLAEATLMVTGDRRMRPHVTLRVDPDELARDRAVPSPTGLELVASGTTVANVPIRIVDPRTFAECPDGRVGEVWASGGGVARGYWRNPEATAEAFLNRPDGRWLRTGDLAFLHEGYLFITGRRKDVVIVRGENRYPQDIEVAIESGVGAVRKGRVSVFSTPFEGREGIGVAAEISRAVRRTTTSADLIAAIDAVVAETQQEPASLIALLEPGALPKTTSGKLQRSACRAAIKRGEIAAFEVYRRPEGAAADADRGDPPRTITERRLARIWAEALGVPSVGRGDRFLALGGHSLLAAQAAARIGREFGVAVALREMFSPRTLSDFARWIDDAPRAAQVPAVPPLAQAHSDGAAPLSLSQRRLWLAERLAAPGAVSAYNVVGRLRLIGPLSRHALERALGELIARHDVLRTAYQDTDDGEPVGHVAASVAFGMPFHDLASLDPEAQARRLGAAEAEEARRPFDLAAAPLMRVTLFRTGETEHSLLLALHHLVCDGWSMGVMVQDLESLYRAARDGEPASLPALPVRYADYAVWQRELEGAPAFERDRAFWRDRLADAPRVFAPPTDFERPATLSQAGDGVRFALSADLVGRLEALGRAYDATLYMVLLAAFDALLHRWSGVEDVLVGADVANRPTPELEGLVGFFVNMLPLRAKPGRDMVFDRLLGEVRDDALAAFDHQLAPFDRIVEAAGAPRDRSRAPLVQVLFVLQSAPRGGFDVDGLTAKLVQAPASSSKFDMAMFLDPVDDGAGRGLACEWAFATALFAKTTIERLAAAWTELLAQIVETPQGALDAFKLPSLEGLKMSAASSPASSTAEARMGAKLDKLKKRTLAAPRSSAQAGGPSEFVRTSTLAPGASFPLVIEPASPDLDAAAWASANRSFVDEALLRHGGLLFRGFALASPQDFEAFAEALQPGLYGGYGDLPKKEGGKNTYRSTPYPENKMILYHNESSHLPRWPRKQWFFCEQPAPVGGATPIVDCREMYRRLPAELAETFDRLGLTYVRTFTSRLDVDWRDFFRTESREEVEAACREQGVEFAWLDGDELQTRTRCPAVIVHPISGERSFFNQIQLHHTRSLDADVRDDLLSMVGPERMPRQVFFGDGSPIPDDVMDLIGELYEACAVRFDWRKGDVVMLDNMLAAHARDPFEGPRRIVVAMGDMVDRSRLADAGEPVR